MLEADAMGANTWPLPLRTSSTVHVIQRLLILNLKTAASCIGCLVNFWLLPGMNLLLYVYLLRRDNVLLQRGPAERMTTPLPRPVGKVMKMSQNMSPMRTIMSEAYLLLLMLCSSVYIIVSTDRPGATPQTKLVYKQM